jgi:hypothetical protein
MAIQNESNVAHDLEALRRKVELLEDKIGRQQTLIDRLRQQVSSMPAVDLPSFIYASTSRATRLTNEWVAPIMVAIAASTLIAVIAWGLWGR